MNDTPRTDNAVTVINEWHGDGICNERAITEPDFARQLERELIAQYDENVERIAAQGKAELDRDRWKAMAEELAECIESFDPRQGYSSTHYTDALSRFSAMKGER